MLGPQPLRPRAVRRLRPVPRLRVVPAEHLQPRAVVPVRVGVVEVDELHPAGVVAAVREREEAAAEAPARVRGEGGVVRADVAPVGAPEPLVPELPPHQRLIAVDGVGQRGGEDVDDRAQAVEVVRVRHDGPLRAHLGARVLVGVDQPLHLQGERQAGLDGVWGRGKMLGMKRARWCGAEFARPTLPRRRLTAEARRAVRRQDKCMQRTGLRATTSKPRTSGRPSSSS